jgi:glutamate synthase (NADPH/NADH) small chain
LKNPYPVIRRKSSVSEKAKTVKKKRKSIKDIPSDTTKMPAQDAGERVNNFSEVNLGFTMDMAVREAARCIHCVKPLCVQGCPVEIDIPGFIKAISDGDMKASVKILKDANMLPAICGRVCPQETQCEILCVVGKKVEPVGIGRLERFVADYAIQHDLEEEPPPIEKREEKIAVVGAGPGGLTVAADLAKKGLDVTIFEALHVAGGVLKYGIPEFRLPNQIIDIEVDALVKLGVKIDLNKVIGKIFTIPQLLEEKGFDAVFVATGAGFPKFMGIPGENLNGVFSANEFLTRANLMGGWRGDDTPMGMGKGVATIGAGNTAMDASRVALRMGADKSYIVYRRSKKESPARAEEIHHAEEEGVDFQFLTNPVRIIGDENGWVKGMECVRMELGEPDDSGRRRPVVIEGSNFIFEVDTVIYALGTAANPIIARTTPGLKTNKWGYIEIDEETGMTSIPGVFAGGDIVTGSATVIEAMGAGRTAARGILKYLGIEDDSEENGAGEEGPGRGQAS